MIARYEGGCLCGAVRYVAEAEPLNERVCHCRLCQKAIGATFNARLLFHREAVRITGAVSRVHTSGDLQRCFCPACGTTVFSSRVSTGVAGITAGSLDDPSLFRPSRHIWTSSRQPWVKLDDGLPQFAEGPPG